MIDATRYVQGSVRALVWAAVIAAVVAVFAAADREPLSPAPQLTRAPAPSGSAAVVGPSLCPPGSLPDHGVCIPVPRQAPAGRRASAWQLGDRVPRRPERTADYGKYVFPVALGSSKAVSSDVGSLAGAAPWASEGAGVVVAAKLGAPVRAVGLEGQKGPARLLAVTELVGPTVATVHTTEAHGQNREYLMLTGNLADPLDGKAGATIEPGTELGRVGDAKSPGEPGLYLEVRRIRAGVDPTSVPVEALVEAARSVPVDIRNVLPIK